jgi:hypothetical protein
LEEFRIGDFMSLPNNKFKPSSGCWKEVNGKMMWHEYLDNFGMSYKDYSPLDLVNISRECSITVVFVREFSDVNSFNSKIKKFWAIDYTIKLRDDVDESIVLRFNNSAWYVSDLKPLGQTFLVPLESDDCLTVNEGEPYPVTQAQAKSLIAKYNRGYGKCEVLANGKLEFYKTV